MKTFRLTLLLLPYLVLMNGCKKDEKKPEAAFQVNPMDPQVNDEVRFTNQSKNANNYEWDFGDGSMSVDKDPVHKYQTPGITEVVLKAVASSGSDTAVRYVDVRVPEELVTIFEGTGISGLNLADDTWKTVKDSFPVQDTLYHSFFLADNNVYINQVYYTKKGVIGVFYSGEDTLSDTDPLLAFFLLPPYAGFTGKSITIGSSLGAVKYAYGNPESIENSGNYNGYTYPGKGIDFYAYKDIDENLVTEIDIYLPNKKSTFHNLRQMAGSAFLLEELNNNPD
ncbi:MAG TPA: PKD domain-containing protein [Bacteroidales bacterium]|nr:PKD domain-containing protein [Bacteroidales bacterium]